jgi:hypothetical protein
MNKRYTEAEVQSIREMLDRRYSFAEVGKEVGRTARSVASKCFQLGLRSNAINGRKSDAADGIKCNGMVTIRLSQKIHERLARHCQRRRISVNEFLAALIEVQVDQ